METKYCSSIKQTLISRLRKDIAVTTLAGQCVFTLPLKTVDDRLTDVFVEPKVGDLFLVHDAGMTSSQLYAQGIHMTEAKTAWMSNIGRRLGVAYANGSFQIVCKRKDIESAILAISQCVSLGMLEVVNHKATFEAEPLPNIVQRTLAKWKPEEVGEITRRLPVKGRKANHEFDFVVFAKAPKFHNIAVSLLPPSYSAQWQADRYGFLVLDTEGTIYEPWRRLAIVTKVDEWGRKPLSLVRDLSSQVLTFKTGEEEQIEELIPQVMDTLLRAA